MAEYLSNIIEETLVTCGVCKKEFDVNDMTIDDWNFAWDNRTKIDCCNDCISEENK